MGERCRPRVLVVNDDAPLATSVCSLLNDENYEVKIALDGEAALATLARWPADLVLLDLIMPRIDGWQFLERRTHDSNLSRVPVLVWSVAAGDELERAERLGADLCLTRTGTGPPQLLTAVAELLTRFPVGVTGLSSRQG